MEDFASKIVKVEGDCTQTVRDCNRVAGPSTKTLETINCISLTHSIVPYTKFY